MIISKPFYLILGIIAALSLEACVAPSQWEFEEEILLDDITPLGIIAGDNYLWVSDVANNRVVKTELTGQIIDQYEGFQRPMHIAMTQAYVYVPEFTADTIKRISHGTIDIFSLTEKPDAPSGVAIDGDMLAVADFYKHRIIVQDKSSSMLIGTEGHEAGKLYYPTDVEIYEGQIYVADAYNNRVQVFDRQGKFVQTVGDSDGIQVAAGITISNRTLFVTDFDGHRILIYDLKGNLIQILEGRLKQPTDISIANGRMFVANYGTQSLLVFSDL